MSWMCAAICVMEVLVCVKFGRGMFPNPHPPVVIWSWAIAIAAFLIWGVWYYGIRPKKKKHSEKQNKKTKVN